MVQAEQSVGCVCVCVRTITVEQNDADLGTWHGSLPLLLPRAAQYKLVLYCIGIVFIPSRLRLMVKIICHSSRSQDKPGIERVQALADISRSALCCHSSETRAPIANLPNSAQLDGTPCIPQLTSQSVQ